MGRSANQQDPLRTEAEARLTRAPLTRVPARPAEELLHELRVHQIELEMQNEELRRAQVALEESRDRYVDLYEFAPLGYLTLSPNGTISEINLSGAALLDVERKKLLNRRFEQFCAVGDVARWRQSFMDVLRHDWQRCELSLRRGKSLFFDAQLDCRKVNGAVRVALTDISERKCAEQQLRELTAHLQSVREEEKASAAREIHDDLGGTLAALKMDAHWLAQRLAAEKENAPLLERAAAMYDLLDDAVHAMRRIITELRPSMLDDLGLLATLKWNAAQFHKRTGIECRVSCIGGEDKLNDALAINLYRIFQENLTNVARHSGASRVEVEFRHDDETVVLSISDNGCGLPQGHTIAPTSYGMHGMRERVLQLGGEILFDNRPGSGLSVTVKLPQPAAPK